MTSCSGAVPSWPVNLETMTLSSVVAPSWPGDLEMGLLRRAQPEIFVEMLRVFAPSRRSLWTLLVLPLTAETPTLKIRMATQMFVNAISHWGLLCDQPRVYQAGAPEAPEAGPAATETTALELQTGPTASEIAGAAFAAAWPEP